MCYFDFSMGRAKSQKTVTISLAETLLAEVDAARKLQTRSEYARSALAEKLESDGVIIPKEFLEPPSRVGKGGQPTHREGVDYSGKGKKSKVVYYGRDRPADQIVAEGGALTLPYLGAVAAGEPVHTELSDEEMIVDRDYPPGHFVVRVNGDSMDPELRDGEMIVVDTRNIFTPGHGRICVVSDGSGSSVKRWNRKTGLLESLNPDYPDLEPSEDMVLQGYYVATVD